MLFLSAAGTPSPDPVSLIMVLVLALAVAVMTVRKYLSRRSATPADSEPTSTSPPLPTSPKAPKAPGSAGQLKLYDVDPKTAAMLMAITANKTGKPLNELRFISIKEVNKMYFLTLAAQAAPQITFEPVNFVNYLQYMGIGMAVIFAIISVIIGATLLINYLFSE